MLRYGKPFRIAIFFLALGVLLAQTGAGRIQGTVKDASGAIIANAKVTAEQVETGNRFDTQSNAAGIFIFPSVQPGKYRVTAESAGMEKWQGELQLLSGQEAVIEPLLKVGGTMTQGTVAGDVTPLI